MMFAGWVLLRMVITNGQTVQPSSTACTMSILQCAGFHKDLYARSHKDLSLRTILFLPFSVCVRCATFNFLSLPFMSSLAIQLLLSQLEYGSNAIAGTAGAPRTDEYDQWSHVSIAPKVITIVCHYGCGTITGCVSLQTHKTSSDCFAVPLLQ